MLSPADTEPAVDRTESCLEVKIRLSYYFAGAGPLQN